jgi:hypothetical protein
MKKKINHKGKERLMQYAKGTNMRFSDLRILMQLAHGICSYEMLPKKLRHGVFSDSGDVWDITNNISVNMWPSHKAGNSLMDNSYLLAFEIITKTNFRKLLCMFESFGVTSRLEKQDMLKRYYNNARYSSREVDKKVNQLLNSPNNNYFKCLLPVNDLEEAIYYINYLIDNRKDKLNVFLKQNGKFSKGNIEVYINDEERGDLFFSYNASGPILDLSLVINTLVDLAIDKKITIHNIDEIMEISDELISKASRKDVDDKKLNSLNIVGAGIAHNPFDREEAYDEVYDDYDPDNDDPDYTPVFEERSRDFTTVNRGILSEIRESINEVTPRVFVTGGSPISGRLNQAMRDIDNSDQVWETLARPESTSGNTGTMTTRTGGTIITGGYGGAMAPGTPASVTGYASNRRFGRRATR